MIGFYDYTVILTYFSLLSATSGIVVALSGGGHPYYGCLFLLFCGFCDAFDGKVARTKKGRTRMEKDFGIQIDSLSDLVAFGVLPACIGAALIRVSPYLTGVLEGLPVRWEIASGKFILHACLVLYVLSAALLFPFVVLLQYMSKTDITLVYLLVSLVTAVLFISPVRVPKPDMRGILIMVGIGAVEFVLLLLRKVIL